jgi:glutathione synthase/RimK-type ligase-like ATP-grasp enzyme
MAEHFDLAVAWDWEHDAQFISCLETQIHAHRLRFFSVSHHNVHETLKRLQKDTLSFGAFLDRASDADETFVPLARHIKKSTILFLNHPDAVHHAADKATMHMEFISKGIHVPFTIIISPYNKKNEVELSIDDLSRLGRPFIIKPANTTGGGIGVILGAETLKDVIDSRQHHKNDKYLLQEKISPVQFHSRKGWFRVFCVCGTVLPCWWDDETHIYQMITRSEVKELGLRPLVNITKKIWEVCKLEFFSTEIATTAEKKFIVVDYVNDICDMRTQSRHPDGVPDTVVTEVCRRIALYLRTT